MREIILQKLYKAFPFPVSGDLRCADSIAPRLALSCLICSRRESSSIDALLHDLSQQSLSKDLYEILICDNSLSGHEALTRKYACLLPIKIIRDTSPDALIGRMKNTLLERSQGKLILFLDDDTRLPQKDFLLRAINLFEKTNADILLPQGHGLPLARDPKYTFLDTYSLANRCSLYRRSVIDAVKGFRTDITAYEDIDLGIRAITQDAKLLKTAALMYTHPPLFFDSMKKPLAIGQSILALRAHYPFHIWTLLYLNAMSLILKALWPTRPNRQWAKIGLGVLLAPFIHERQTYAP